MRALAVLATLCLLTLASPAAQAALDPPVECDVDDDLYNHCRAGPVHWVTGPFCAGVALYKPAECFDLRRLLA